MLIRKHPVIRIRASTVTYSPYDSPTAKWAARVGLFLSNLIIESTAPFVLISIGIRMRNSNKIQNRPIQAGGRPSRRSRRTLPFYSVLTEQCRDRKDLDLDPRIFILHFTGLRLDEFFYYYQYSSSPSCLYNHY